MVAFWKQHRDCGETYVRCGRLPISSSLELDHKPTKPNSNVNFEQTSHCDIRKNLTFYTAVMEALVETNTLIKWFG